MTVQINPSSLIASVCLENDSLWSKIRHYKDASYHSERTRQITLVFTQSLLNLPRITPSEAENTPLVLAARKWLKSLSPTHQNDQISKNCSRELLAVRLGVASKVFDENPGFEQFAKKSVLYNYLSRYGHFLKVTENHELYILYQNEYQPWSKLKIDECPSSPQPSQPWYYGMEGIQQRDMYNWSILEPFMRNNPEKWGSQYGIEFCTSCTDRPRQVGDHTWIRLYTSEGEIYSYGKYRPGKVSKKENYDRPFRQKKGYGQSPDVSEFWGDPIQTLFIAITEKQFNVIKRKIDKKKQRDEDVFQLFADNCTMEANRWAAKAGIYLPTEASVLYVYAPPTLKRAFKWCSDSLPHFIQKICLFVGSMIFNIIQYFLGATRIDPVVKGYRRSIRPHLNSIWDVFRIHKANIHAPHYLSTHVRQEIEDWREKKLQKTVDVEKRLKIQFGVPKRYCKPQR